MRYRHSAKGQAAAGLPASSRAQSDDGTLPNDAQLLAKVSKVHRPHWAKMWEAFRPTAPWRLLRSPTPRRSRKPAPESILSPQGGIDLPLGVPMMTCSRCGGCPRTVKRVKASWLGNTVPMKHYRWIVNSRGSQQRHGKDRGHPSLLFGTSLYPSYSTTCV